MKFLLTVVAVGLLATPSIAAPTVDGSISGDGYGAALAVQTTQTGFGDNSSELNAAYATIDSGKLYVAITGNLEGNFNKLSIFIDSAAGGQSTFISAGNDNSTNMTGMVFDNGFTADYHLIVRRGNDFGNDKFDVDIADLGAATFDSYQDFLTGGGQEGTGTTGTGTVNSVGMEWGYDNSNVAGVTGGNGAANQADALAVTTGLEFSVSLSDIGYTGGAINIMAGVNGGGHDFWSNQFLGGLGTPSGNLGNAGANGEPLFDFSDGGTDINFATQIAGRQFFTLVPEPTALAMAGLAALGMLCSRRR